jgi:hypothetical protein
MRAKYAFKSKILRSLVHSNPPKSDASRNDPTNNRLQSQKMIVMMASNSYKKVYEEYGDEGH